MQINAILILASLCSVLHFVNSTYQKTHKVYGTHKDRLSYKTCKALKCQFIKSGCLSAANSSFACRFTALKMTLIGKKICPWHPCVSFNQPTGQCCLSSNLPCEGNPLPFGICPGSQHCCSTGPQTTSPLPLLNINSTASSSTSQTTAPLASFGTMTTTAAPTTSTATTTMTTTGTTGPPPCEVPGKPLRQCVEGFICSIDSAVLRYDNLWCAGSLEICCEWPS